MQNFSTDWVDGHAFARLLQATFEPAHPVDSPLGKTFAAFSRRVAPIDRSSCTDSDVCARHGVPAMLDPAGVAHGPEPRYPAAYTAAVVAYTAVIRNAHSGRAVR